jgi:transcriptional regulator with XRE-family HTH domain
MATAIALRFGENLRRCRRRAGLSQEQFADLAGIHRTAVSKFERGETQPMLETLVKAACALGAPVDELLDGINWRAPNRDFGSFEIAAQSDRNGAPIASPR